MSDTPATFTFRAPGPYMSMNDRDHWQAKRRKVKGWRRTAWAAAGRVAGFCPTPADVWIALDVPDRRRRDPHNLYPTIKAIIDGMVDAGCWPDDTPEYVTTHEPTFHVVPRGQAKCVTVTVTERAA
jgi:hypothetical protein